MLRQDGWGTAPEEITLFKSVGTSIADLAAAVVMYERQRTSQ